jgi:branched-chain amino acid transport system permease protein
MRRGAALLALAALLPLALPSGGDMVNNMVLAAIYAVMALGLNIVVGFAGLLDLGYVAFFAIGAYTAAYLFSGYRGIHVSFLIVLVAAAAATMGAGALIGVPTLRLRGDYIAIVTLAFGEIIGQIVTNGRDVGFFGGPLTSGPIGIGPIDRIDLPLLPRFTALDLRPWYWTALALVALVLVVNVRLRSSRVGRAWIALRDDEAAAVHAGIPAARTKLLAYGTGAALGGVAGAFFASYLSTVNPIQFSFSFSILIFSMVVLGGLGSIGGVVAGAIALSVVNNLVLPGAVGFGVDLSSVASLVYGTIIVVMMLLRPEGLLPARVYASSNRGAGEIARLR